MPTCTKPQENRRWQYSRDTTEKLDAALWLVNTTNEVEEATAQLWLDDVMESMNRAEQLGHDVDEDMLAKLQ